MRLGKTVVYQGKEFNAGSSDVHSINVISNDSSDVAHGFSMLEPGVYVKAVLRTAVDDAFYRSGKASYKGRVFSVVSADNVSVELYSPSALPELGFELTGHGEWTKTVRHDECDRVWEERRPF